MERSVWWPDWSLHKTEENPSILDILKWGEIDFKLAGLLWLLMEQRSSLIVASGPSWAGKTTLFHALLDFLPPQVNQVSLRGFDEDFLSLGDKNPANTYLISEEISNHQYEYIWGEQVIKAFELLPKGYALGSTMHARNIREVAYLLSALGVRLPLIASLGTIITLQVTYGGSRYDELIRYVDSVSTVSFTEDSLVAQTLAMRRLPSEKFVYPDEKSLHDILLHKFSVKYDSVSSEIELRGRYLSQLYLKGVSGKEVRKKIAEYYISNLL